MTYNVFDGTSNFALSIYPHISTACSRLSLDLCKT